MAEPESPTQTADAKEPSAEAAGAPSVRPAAPSSFPATLANGGPLGAYEALARAARLPDLVAITHRVVGDAAAARTAGWSHATKVIAAADEAKLTRSDADTPYGNALKVLESGPEGATENALACALWAHAVAEARRDDEDRLAGDVLWLATHTAFDATPLLDRALGDEAADLWRAIGDRVRRVDDGVGTTLGRAEAIVGCAALAGSDATAKVRGDLARRVKDPVLKRILEGTTGGGESVDTGGDVRLEGEAMPAPRGVVATTLLAFTGLLFVIGGARLLARLALAYRRPAAVTLSASGIRMTSRTEMLGKTLREREQVIVRAGLVRVVREVRYPRAALYAGLFGLAFGSYYGVRAFSDGVRAASPSLLLVGFALVAVGIAVDFVFGSLVPGSLGRVRVIFVGRTGGAVCIGGVDARRADEAIARILNSR